MMPAGANMPWQTGMISENRLSEQKIKIFQVSHFSSGFRLKTPIFCVNIFAEYSPLVMRGAGPGGVITAIIIPSNTEKPTSIT